MTLLEAIKGGTHVEMINVSDGHANYVCYGATDGRTWGLEFRIPVSDMSSGDFPRTDPAVRYYQRWIRKALEEQKILSEAIEAGKNAGKPGYIQCGCGFTHRVDERCGP